MQTRNLKYNRSGTVDMEIEHPKYGWIPFTASPNDSEQRGRELYAAAIAGEFGAIAAYIAPIKTVEEENASIQAQIDMLERQQLMPRVTREALLGIALQQAATLGMTETQLADANTGFRKLR